MKNTYKFFWLLIFVSQIAAAQTIEKRYFNKEGITRDPNKSIYYRVAKKIPAGRKAKAKGDSLYVDSVRTFYTKTNAIHSRAYYRDGKLTGPYTMYHENGMIKEKGVYKEDGKIGYVNFWNDKGNINQTLEYFPEGGWVLSELDSFKIINYWDSTGIQLIKDGNGQCKCSFYNTWPLEEGKVTGGYREGKWKITSGDTLVATEEYHEGHLLKGESTYQGRKFSYQERCKQAEFKNGLKGMMKFLQQNIKYPASAKRAGMQGKVFVRFNVDEKGIISSLEILKGVSEELNEEAMRVIRIMPSWIPAKLRGIPVESTFVLPVYFKLAS